MLKCEPTEIKKNYPNLVDSLLRYASYRSFGALLDQSGGIIPVLTKINWHTDFTAFLQLLEKLLSETLPLSFFITFENHFYMRLINGLYPLIIDSKDIEYAQVSVKFLKDNGYDKKTIMYMSPDKIKNTLFGLYSQNKNQPQIELSNSDVEDIGVQFDSYSNS